MSHVRLGELDFEQLDARRLGAKGAWLHWLARHGAPVPAGFVLRPEAVAAVAGEGVLDDDVRGAVARLVPGDEASALVVRASPMRSQPGNLPTHLGCESEGAVVRALCAIEAAARARGEPCAAVVQREISAAEGGFAAAVFTRDPSRGHAGPRGGYHPGGPGGALMDGRHDLPDVREGEASLRSTRPEAYEALRALAERLEHAAGRILELELVHDGSSLWVVQARPVAREGLAAIRLANERAARAPAAWLDLRAEDAEGQWVERVTGDAEVLARGLAASPGVATGLPVCDPAEAERRGAAGESVILVRAHAVPEDVAAVTQSEGVLTSTGGLTCHAAVIARGLGKPAVVSCRALEIGAQGVRLGGEPLAFDRPLTLDGHSGAIHAGQAARVRLPSGAPVRALLAKLRARRRVQLWVHGLPAPLWPEAAALGADGLLLDTVPAPEAGVPASPQGLQLWAVEAGGSTARRLDEEQSGPTCVRMGEWNRDDASEAQVLRVTGAPGEGSLAATALALAVPAEHMLAWALTLDPVRASAHNGPIISEPTIA